ncbi:MAG: ATP-binding cassette domain-containing protein, partial [Armatimonadota bacterium]
MNIERVAPDVLAPPTDRPIKLSTDNLNFYYGSTQALKNVTLHIHNFEITALIGPSGCGKSTFLRAFNRMNELIPGTRTSGEVLFHGIAVKPGKPTLFGFIQGTPVFGMPGYPTSCLSNAYMLLIEPLRRMARLPAWTPRTAALPLGQRVVSTTGRHQFYTVRIVDGQAMPAFKASGDISS